MNCYIFQSADCNNLLCAVNINYELQPILIVNSN